jgi:hypothetical protein
MGLPTPTEYATFVDLQLKDILPEGNDDPALHIFLGWEDLWLLDDAYQSPQRIPFAGFCVEWKVIQVGGSAWRESSGEK